MRKLSSILGALSFFLHSFAAFGQPFLNVTAAPPAFFLNWTASQGGPYTQAPNVVNYAVFSPSGAAPTQADLPSHRYQHHTQIAWNPALTRVWIGSSSSLNNEDASGQMTMLYTSVDNGVTWSAPITGLPPQDTMSDTTGNSASRIGWSRRFVAIGSQLYYISAVQTGSSGTALALVAVACNDDGSVGAPFLISTSTYTALGCCTQLTYDGVLGPQLFPSANLLGVWGGSQFPASTTSAWQGWAYQGTQSYTEAATFSISGGIYARLWRQTTGTTTKFWSNLVDSNANTLSALLPTNIPNNPSECAALTLSDGRIAVVLNPNDGTNRTNIALGLFDGLSGQLLKVYYIRTGISPTPTYPGTNKSGGGAYFGLFQKGNILWISYSLQKESIGASSVDVSAL